MAEERHLQKENKKFVSYSTAVPVGSAQTSNISFVQPITFEGDVYLEDTLHSPESYM